MLSKDDILFIKNLITTKLFNARNRLERIKISGNNPDMKEEINLDIDYMLTLIKKLEELW